MKRIDLIQGSSEWHAYRSKHIGSSEIASIMGIGFKTPYQLWEEKIGLREQEAPNEAMKRGSAMEAEALKAYSSEYVPGVFECELYPFMSASMDGVKICDDIVVNAVEIKCCGEKIHSRLIQGDIPDYYIAQMQWQMNILDLYAMDLFAYSPTSFKVIKVERDQEYIYKMIEKAKEFWECIQTKTPPPLTDRDYPVKDDLNWSMTVASHKDARAMLAYYEAKESELRQELIKQAGNSNARGCGIKLTKVIRKGAIDYEAIPELIRLDLEAYRKKNIESFRITNERDPT